MRSSKHWSLTPPPNRYPAPSKSQLASICTFYKHPQCFIPFPSIRLAPFLVPYPNLSFIYPDYHILQIIIAFSSLICDILVIWIPTGPRFIVVTSDLNSSLLFVPLSCLLAYLDFSIPLQTKGLVITWNIHCSSHRLSGPLPALTFWFVFPTK